MAFRRQSWKAKGVRDLIPPPPWPAPVLINIEVIIQATTTTAARIVRAGIRIMPGLATIAASQVGTAG
ncbi:hypothetical protein LFZ35_16545 [Salmonella enterica subsp. enterica serovar Onderstepoort str. SA20060086]|nr:hypothetical protein LFZ35_16545 [Salmonella enterica subsp. enterica serovar Onderstepoort str. SA20060086]